MKPVYISGGSNFKPNEIKRALDEVRNSLGLPEDVVLFGVPVDGQESDSVDEVPVKVVNAKNKQPARHASRAEVQYSTDETHKVIQFHPKKSILNVISSGKPSFAKATAGEQDTEDEITLPDNFLSTKDEVQEIKETAAFARDGDESITALFAKVPALEEEPSRPTLVQEFSNYLDAEEKTSPAKKTKPFARKSRGTFNNVLGDLFSFAGMAANDDAEEFKLPDFIKRP